MKKFFLILCVSTAIMNAMYDDDSDDIIPSGEKQLSVISETMPMLEAALAQWQLATQQNPRSAITNMASCKKVTDAISKPRNDAYKYVKVVKPLALINLLALQSDSDNPHNKTVFGLLSSFNKIKPQFESLAKSDEEISLLCWALSVLEGQQERYENTAKALQEHVKLKKTEESFFEEHKNDYSMIFDRATFNMFAKYFTPDTHQIRNDLDGVAFSKDSDELYASKKSNYE